MLTAEQVETFHLDGYLLGQQVLSNREVATLQDEVLRVIAEHEDKKRPQPVWCHNMGKAESPVWQIVNICRASAPFARLIFNPTITQEIAQLTGAATLRLWHDQIQYKPVKAGGVNMWHQDHPYWPIIAPPAQVTAWVALDDVDVDNGCMSMVPKSHLWGNHIKFLEGLSNFDAMPGEHLGHKVVVRKAPVKKGHVHYHHAMTWHGSHANTSRRPRRAIALHYMTEQTRYVPAGDHPMKQFVTVGAGEVLQGEDFPVVWSKG